MRCYRLFLDGYQLYESFHRDQPWDSPHHKTLSKGAFLAEMTGSTVRFIPEDVPRARVEAPVVRNDGHTLKPDDCDSGAP